MVAITYHSDVYLFSKRLRHVGRNGLANIPIKLHPVMMGKVTGNNVRIGWIKDQSGVMFKSEVSHNIEGSFQMSLKR